MTQQKDLASTPNNINRCKNKNSSSSNNNHNHSNDDTTKTNNPLLNDHNKPKDHAKKTTTASTPPSSSSPSTSNTMVSSSSPPKEIPIPKTKSYPTTTTTTIKLLILLLIIYRVTNALLIQTQFDPDEYWQTLEPSYCLSFNENNCAYTWEWKRRWTLENDDDDDGTLLESSSSSSSSLFFFYIVTPILKFVKRSCHGPIRSHVGLIPTLFFYHVVVKIFSFHDDIWDSSFLIMSRGPLIIHALLIVVSTDISCFVISREVVVATTGGHDADSVDDDHHCRRYYRERMTMIMIVMAEMTCWFLGYALVRTYSNSMECFLIVGGLGLMSQDLFGRTTSSNPPNHIYSYPSGRTALAYIGAGFSIALRFSAIAAWIPTSLAYCWRRRLAEQKRRSINETSSFRLLVRYTIGPCIGFTTFGLFLACVLDRYFYGFWTVPFLGSFHFNVMQGHGSLYGTHPFHWYFTSCLPAISGVMLPFFLHNSYNVLATTTLFFRQRQQHTTNKNNNNNDDDDDDEQQTVTNRLVILFIITVYTLIHSFSSHKELRFLLPILPLVCILSGHSMEQFCRRRRRLATTTTTATKPPSFESYWHYYCPYKTILLMSLFFIGNYPPLYYLARIHQRAPIMMNRSILKFLTSTAKARRTTTKPSTTKAAAEVHYLMGCHSTPLYSHLHSDIVSITAWTLDCSPDCRVSKNCESDAFLSDPKSFLERTYGVGEVKEADGATTTVDYGGEDGDMKECRRGDDDDANNNNPTSTQQCHHRRLIPDCLVMFENDASSFQVKNLLRHRMGLKEIDRQPHVINGLRIKWGTIVDLKWGALSEKEEGESNENPARVTNNDDGSFFIHVSFEHMILYAKVELALLD